MVDGGGLLSNNYQYRTCWESNPNWRTYLHCHTACELEDSRSLIDHRHVLCLNNDLSRHVNWPDYNRFNRFLIRKSCLIMLAQLLREKISLYSPYYLEHTHRRALIHNSTYIQCRAVLCLQLSKWFKHLAYGLSTANDMVYTTCR